MAAPAVIVPQFFLNTGIVEWKIENNDFFQILGDFCQVVHLKLGPGQSIQCEPGTMCYMSEECMQAVKLSGFGRMLMDGTLMKCVFTNKSAKPGYIGITSNLPGNIIPLNLDRMGGAVKAKKEAFMAAMDEKCRIRLTTIRPASCFACLCADVPFFMQEISAKGWVFLSAHGTIMQKELREGEEIVVDGGSFVACSMSVTCDVRRAGNCVTMCCGSEGLFNTALRGPGMVLLSSMPMEKLRNLFVAPPPRNKNKNNAVKV